MERNFWTYRNPAGLRSTREGAPPAASRPARVRRRRRRGGFTTRRLVPSAMNSKRASPSKLKSRENRGHWCEFTGRPLREDITMRNL